MKAGELCAGYGGLALAVEEVFGAQTVWFSEFDAAPSKILAHHWPDVPNHGDMTAIDWNAIEQVDIISGGTPCQDLSGAGKRKGMTEGTRSNLWVHMREAIAAQQPTYVVWENVRGAYSATADSDLEHCSGCMGGAEHGGTVLRALGRVLGDLSDLGYDAEWRGLRAADVGACHGRYRVFALARRRAPANANNQGLEGQRNQDGTAQTKRRRHVSESANSAATNAECLQRKEGRQSAPGQEKEGGASNQSGRRSGAHTEPNSEVPSWLAYEPAVRRWEAVRGAAPNPTELNKNGKHRLSARFAEWMMGLSDGWVTDPAIGITRNDQLKACGNGVVPQQAIAALKDMLNAFKEGG